MTKFRVAFETVSLVSASMQATPWWAESLPNRAAAQAPKDDETHC